MSDERCPRCGAKLGKMEQKEFSSTDCRRGHTRTMKWFKCGTFVDQNAYGDGKTHVYEGHRCDAIRLQAEVDRLRAVVEAARHIVIAWGITHWVEPEVKAIEQALADLEVLHD